MSQPVPVLIAGAGPTGLSLAIMLRLMGIEARLIDRNTAPAAVSKALAVWSGSLEALGSMGVVDRFEAAGTRLKALVIGDGPKVLASLVVGEGIDSPYPFPLLLPQSETEAILTQRLSELGGSIERGVELKSFTQDATGVTANLIHWDGTVEEVRAAYIVGADGARSTVRHTLNIEFEGYTEPQAFILGDVRIDGGDLDRASIYIWWHGGATVALFPFEGDTWRLFGARPDASDETAPTLAELQTYMDEHGPPGCRLRDPSWLSVFRTNERLAATYRVGRAFLAGDAAHIHSPAGGQGMNTGIQDAVNLAWKLASVLGGRGDAEVLLGSYEPERRPVAEHVVKGSAQRLHVAFAGSRVTQFVRDMAVTVIGHLPAAQKALQTELSETAITYHDGPLVALGNPPRHPHRTEVGTRALEARFLDPSTGAPTALWPLIGGLKHTLLLFPNDAIPLTVDAAIVGCGDHLEVVSLPPASDPEGKARARYRITKPGWVLIRPDQVVAARGPADDLTPLAAYLDKVVRMAEA
ncbi:oxygenase [Azorhizobium oxalatiphilum]|uniref:Oxygenase n=1 Tax=Azorhizobium oxalatiphilum TaxID=980631 RepID=A0A917F446_9HYPH|nr:FAD-dependent monooxygenase [Azorhizobium oxalatiphilum]GGF48530.1 oxygenase [Azorhizobium oxalatiphilum]